MATQCNKTICENIFDAKVLYIKTSLWCIECHMNIENRVSCKNYIKSTCTSRNPLIYADCFKFKYEDFTCPFKTTSIFKTIKTSTKWKNLNSSSLTTNPNYLSSRNAALAGGIAGGTLALMLMILIIFIIVCFGRKKKLSKSSQNSIIQKDAAIFEQPSILPDNRNTFNLFNVQKSSDIIKYDNQYTDKIYSLAESFDGTYEIDNSQIYKKLDFIKNIDKSEIYTSLVTQNDKNKIANTKENTEMNIYEDMSDTTKISSLNIKKKKCDIEKSMKIFNNIEMNIYENEYRDTDNYEAIKVDSSTSYI